MTQPTDPQPTPAPIPPTPIVPTPAPEPAPVPPAAQPTDPIQPPEPTTIPTNRTFSIAGLTITPAEIRKFIVALTGAVAIAVTQGLIQGTAAKWCAIIIGFATAIGVHQVSNAQPAETSEGG